MPDEEHDDGGNCSDCREHEEHEKTNCISHSLISRLRWIQPRNETENPVPRAQREECIDNGQNERKRVVE